jgi:arylsulfatase
MKEKNNYGIIIFVLLVTCILYFVYAQKIWVPRLAKRPNILLITICSLRQDHLGCYGYSRNTSPNIDILANASIIYKNCHTHIPWTKPSIIALMTGKYPASAVTVEKEIPLAALLHSIGYLTCGVIGTNVARQGAKVDTGFETFLDNRNLKTSKDPHSVQADTIASEAIEFLNKSQTGREPIFLWLLFKDPHWPYMPPLGYKRKFLHDLLYEQHIQKLVINDNYNNSIGGIGEARLTNTNGDFITDKAYYISQYDAEILFTDNQIGRIIEYLKQKGGYDDWVIILLSDHGESLGEDNYFFDHGYKLTEGTTRIPLIIKLPRHKKREVTNIPTSICDVYPTIMKLAGLHEDMSKNNIYGRNILDQDRLGQNRYNSVRTIMLENAPGHEDEHMKLLGCIWKSYKIIHNITINKKTLYNISKEESRLGNYDAMEQKIIVRMSKFIASFFNNFNNVSTVSREELKSLGYLQ